MRALGGRGFPGVIGAWARVANPDEKKKMGNISISKMAHRERKATCYRIGIVCYFGNGCVMLSVSKQGGIRRYCVGWEITRAILLCGLP